MPIMQSHETRLMTKSRQTMTDTFEDEDHVSQVADVMTNDTKGSFVWVFYEEGRKCSSQTKVTDECHFLEPETHFQNA